jgi:hypothetical protein
MNSLNYSLLRFEQIFEQFYFESKYDERNKSGIYVKLEYNRADEIFKGTVIYLIQEFENGKYKPLEDYKPLREYTTIEIREIYEIYIRCLVMINHSVSDKLKIELNKTRAMNKKLTNFNLQLLLSLENTIKTIVMFGDSKKKTIISYWDYNMFLIQGIRCHLKNFFDFFLTKSMIIQELSSPNDPILFLITEERIEHDMIFKSTESLIMNFNENQNLIRNAFINWAPRFLEFVNRDRIMDYFTRKFDVSSDFSKDKGLIGCGYFVYIKIFPKELALAYM